MASTYYVIESDEHNVGIRTDLGTGLDWYPGYYFRHKNLPPKKLATAIKFAVARLIWVTEDV